MYGEKRINNFEKFDDTKEEPTANTVISLIGERGYLLEEYGFDQETITEILALDFKDALETAYSYITSAREDADQILAELFE